MRIRLIGLLAATALTSTAAVAQYDPNTDTFRMEPQAVPSGMAPFGAASAPLSAEEMQAIKAEGEAKRRAAADAARRAEERREAAEHEAMEREAAAAAERDAMTRAPVEATIPPAGMTSPMDNAAGAPVPPGAAPEATTIVPNAVIAPNAPGGVAAVPVEPMSAPPGAPVPAPDMPEAPYGSAPVAPMGEPAPMPMDDDNGIPPLPVSE